MRTEVELLELFKSANLDSYEVYTEIGEASAMQLMNLEDLMQFSCKHNIDTMFYHYSFIDEDLLSITEEVTSKLRLDEDTLLILHDKFDEYNKSVLELDFNKPVSLKIYCIYQGVIFFTQEDDYWFFEQGFGMPETACEELANKYYEDILAEKKNKKQMIADARIKLREQILKDVEFQRCTNEDLRRGYASKLFEDSKENKSLFYSEKGGLYDIPIYSFIEDVWREYKGSLKR